MQILLLFLITKCKLTLKSESFDLACILQSITCREGSLSNGDDLNGGMITFGGYDYTHCSSTIDYAPLVTSTNVDSIWMFLIAE